MTANVAPASRISSTTSPEPVVHSDHAVLRHVDPQGLFSAVRSLKKKGTVLNVWATWCGPCRDELPMLGRVAKTYKARGIEVIPLSVDEPESEGKIAGMLQEFGFAPPYYVTKPPIAAMKMALHEEWPGNIPVSFILDGSAKPRYFFNAEVYEDELTPQLDALLNGSLPIGRTGHGLIPGLTL